MKILKKNQFVIYAIVLMIMVAGYLNYSADIGNLVETSMQMESSDDTKMADIGDATLVNSNDVAKEEDTNNDNINTNVISKETNTTENTINNTNETNNSTEASKEANTQATKETNNSSEYFTKSKLERDTMYSQMVETYEKVLNSTNSLETQKQTATQEIQKINNIKNSIMICENLIDTKGFNNNIVFVNGDSISVIIEASELKQEEVAQIQNIVSRELNANIENIHITCKN